MWHFLLCPSADAPGLWGTLLLIQRDIEMQWASAPHYSGIHVVSSEEHSAEADTCSWRHAALRNEGHPEVRSKSWLTAPLRCSRGFWQISTPEKNDVYILLSAEWRQAAGEGEDQGSFPRWMTSSLPFSVAYLSPFAEEHNGNTVILRLALPLKPTICVDI